MELGLSGKVALITGGSDGIGKATAIAMGHEGVKVAICARNPERLKAALDDIRGLTGGEVLAVPAYVRNQEQIERLFDETLRRFGRLDILVNNAGGSAAGPLLETDDDIWHGDLDTKLFGALRCSRLAIPHMIEAGGGRIINVTSIWGKHPGAATVPTTVSRAAGIALTKAMSREFAPHGILVNTVCIGLARSGQFRREWEELQAEGTDLTEEEFYAQQAEGIPLGH
ncbi:MAG: SDR family NAD(P)-dependent oxidoreductase, partial [Chloroflexota bacterium]|nr:SDR family NAD(P)-dependent oxidoreductase [Chloroflexota bacterium]